MLEKLKFEDFNKQPLEQIFEGIKVHDECYVDINQEIKEPPIAISKGHDFESKHIPIVTYGNFACLVGASKSMKSFLKSGLEACYVGGHAQNYFSDIIGHNSKGKYVISIDTEQGKYHVQRVVKRVNGMIGQNYAGYVPFALRPKEPKERVLFIEWILTESKYAGKIGLLTIDGIADLIDNVNDLDASNEITQKLMSWSSDYNIAIITVLHRNFDSNKPTGHLGSAVLKKAETVMFLNKDESIVEVQPKYTRNMPFDAFSFTVNEQGIPEEITAF